MLTCAFYLQEFLRCSVDFADLVGLYIVLSRIPGKGHSKLITAGLGWATAEVILSRGLMLWVGARGAEFSWLYIQKCLDSNISLVCISAIKCCIFRSYLKEFSLSAFVRLDPTFDNRNITLVIHTSRFG